METCRETARFRAFFLIKGLSLQSKYKSGDNMTLSSFYRSKEWESLRAVLMVERVNEYLF